MTRVEIMKKFNCGSTQYYEILKNKEEIVNEWLQNGNGERKRKTRITGNEEINHAVWEWFLAARAKNLPVSGPILQSQALAVAEKLKVTNFKASTGWLDSFKTRHKIVFNNLCGEARDVDEEIVSDWHEKLQSLISNYAPQDIYNGDETGLFFRALPTKSLTLRGEKCVGGKMSKERLTVFLCGNMLGNMEKAVVIGKAKKPRCFKKLDISSLPVTWLHNSKAWMTSVFMEDWLQKFNQKMANQGRKVILFMDNATCHPRLTLSNVKLAWFPPNTSSHTQPMDQGVIYTFKCHYRRSVLQSLIPKMALCSTVHNLAKEISVLDAVHWISAAVKQIQANTVIKCFEKAGFKTSSTLENSPDEASESLASIRSLFSENDILLDAEDYVRSDDIVVTERNIDSACDLIPEEDDDDEGEAEKEEEEEHEATESEDRIKDARQALLTANHLIQYAASANSPELLTPLYQLKSVLEKTVAEQKKRQQTLTELWNKTM